MIVIIFLAICFGAVLVKSFILQVLDHEEYLKMANQRHIIKMRQNPNRGAIYDRNNLPLAKTIKTYSIFIHPNEFSDVENKSKIAKRMGKILGIKTAKIKEKFRSKSKFKWIARQVSVEKSKAVKELGIDQIHLQKEADRNYLFGWIGASLLGFTGSDLQGLGGLEVYYEDILKGKGGTQVGARDGHGKPLYLDGIVVKGESKGLSLRLTIDATIQMYADWAMAEVFARYGAKGACAIVMDPYTGEILAMSSQPTFDPNISNNYIKNIAVSDIFEPGSTFKPFTIAAALENKTIFPAERIFCHNGSRKFGDRIIHDTHPHQYLTPGGILQKSSNIGAGKVAMRLGAPKLHQAVTAFGFGKKTGIDFLGEPAGIVHSVKKWGPVQTSNISFGQGIAATPIQMATAFCALVNGGNLMKPYLVSEIIDGENRVVEDFNHTIVRRVISEKTSGIITDMLTLVTRSGGTATRAAIHGFEVAGKTGTAEKSEKGGYSKDKRVSSFIGAVPAEKPEVVILVLIDEPKGPAHMKYGGVCAAPVFRRIADQTLRYRGRFSQGVFSGDKSDSAHNFLSNKDKKNKSRFGRGEMPKLVGLSVRNALNLAHKHGLDLAVFGYGVAVEQSPLPGTKMNSERKVRALFLPAS